MPSFRWSSLFPVLCNVGVLTFSTTASAFQYPPLSDDLNTRQIHGADAWIDGEFRSTGNINESPADFGPASGMWQRTADGNPASGDSFQTMQAGPLPGGLSPNGFNGSGMIPALNQPDYITNNPAFGGRGFGINGQMPNGNTPFNGQFNGQNNGQFNGNAGFGSNQRPPNAGFNPNARPAARVQQGMTSASAKQPYVGLLGQVSRPGVYEIASGRETLADLIEKIGGLAKDASGQLRIIRNGRPGQSTSYSAAAYFELLPGDLVIADAQATRGPNSGAMRSGDSASAQSGASSRQASSSYVQIGFVNLLDRPVVLKLKSENANVPAILAMMRQDGALASEINVVPPSGQSQRFQNQNQQRPDASLPSETVLIFPRNAVATERLDHLPKPTMLKTDQDADDANQSSQPQRTPPAQISPDVSSRPSSSQTSDAGSAVTYVPPPPTFAEESSQQSRYAPQRVGGVRGSSRDQISRDTNMVLAPPAEGVPPPFDASRSASSRSLSIGSLPTREVPASTLTHEQDTAPAPSPMDSVWNEDRDPSAEPSRLNAAREPRPITEVNGKGNGLDEIISDDDATADPASDPTNKAATTWSIWPPLLTAGVGLIALLGFSFSLRRRTQSEWERSTLPRTGHEYDRAAVASIQATSLPTSAPIPASTRTAPVAMTRDDVTQPLTASAPVEVQFHNVPQPQTVTQTSAKQTLLDALINNQLPMTEEKVTFVSPLQFHGRPAAPRNLRLDSGHELPKPHAPSIAPQPTRRPAEPMKDAEPMNEIARDEVAGQTVSYGETQKFRLDQSSSTTAKPASRFVPAKRPTATTQKASSINLSGTPHSAVAPAPVTSSRRPVAVTENASSPLDRALSAVQKREERS